LKTSNRNAANNYRNRSIGHLMAETGCALQVYLEHKNPFHCRTLQ